MDSFGLIPLLTMTGGASIKTAAYSVGSHSASNGPVCSMPLESPSLWIILFFNLRGGGSSVFGLDNVPLTTADTTVLALAPNSFYQCAYSDRATGGNVYNITTTDTLLTVTIAEQHWNFDAFNGIAFYI